MAEVIDEIRARVHLVDLVGQRVSLSKAGKVFKGLCPFHNDRNPSFQVSPLLNRYTCWSCGEKGDAFTWVMKTQNVDFKEALEILAQLAGVELKPGKRHQSGERAVRKSAMEDALAFFRKTLEETPQARQYCSQRGLDESVLARWEIGFAPGEGTALASHLKGKGHVLSECKKLFLVEDDRSGGFYDKFRDRLIFPIRDERGELVAFGGRLITQGNPKYINSGDTPLYRKSRVLFGLHHAREAMQKNKPAVLVEGYLDVIACHMNGIDTAVASLGTAVTEEHAKLLHRWTSHAVVLYDGDAAGQKATERALGVFAAEGLIVRAATLAEGEDPDTIGKKSGAAGLQAVIRAAVPPIDFAIERLRLVNGYSSDQFWSEAVALLSQLDSERDVERVILALSSHHPDLRDVNTAQRALRSDVNKHRTKRARSGRAAIRAPQSVTRHEVSAAERLVFLSLFERELCSRVIEICSQADLFETARGSEIAKCIAENLAGAPTSEPAVWINLLGDESIIEALSSLHLASNEPLSILSLEGAISQLQRARETRRLRVAKLGAQTDEDKAAVLAGLKTLKA